MSFNTEALNLSEADFSLLAQQLPGPLVVLRNDRCLFVNPALKALLGFTEDENWQGQHWEVLVHPDSFQSLSHCLTAQHLHLQAQKDGCKQLELKLLGKQETVIEAEVSISSCQLASGAAVVLQLRDLAGERCRRALLQQQANRDSLTGLPNRALFYDRLGQELAHAQRDRQQLLLVFIDLDHFKWVNDSLGHAAGDDLLVQVGERLNGCIRQSDTLARLGGDEFTIILPGLPRGQQAERVVTKILQELGRSFVIKDKDVDISGSIGIALYPEDADNADDLINHADTAMYRAKSEGGGRYQYFTQELHAEAMQRMAMEKDLLKALERGQLRVHYQPIIELATGRLAAVESLIRWQHPERGLLTPGLFLNVAEELGLSLGFGQWLSQEACAQTQAWRERLGIDGLKLSINLFCRHCRNLLSAEYLQQVLTRTGLPPQNLVLEITESIVGGKNANVIEHLRALKALGASLWLDDFGTGQSSLSLLKRLPVDGVKVDQVFISSLETDPDSANLVEAILSLMQSFGLALIGEGVETQVQRDFLLGHGCQLAQGYFFARPMAAAEFETWALEYLAACRT
jgi:diguanylate cyclase (GGDEF)-like protein/PAS domain S-box-containing protein